MDRGRKYGNTALAENNTQMQIYFGASLFFHVNDKVYGVTFIIGTTANGWVECRAMSDRSQKFIYQRKTITPKSE